MMQAVLKLGAGWSFLGQPAITTEELIQQIYALALPGWSFRGEAEWHETHLSTLGRVLSATAPEPLVAECELINRFMHLSHAFQSYSEHAITHEDVLGTLTLMQHHGAPTRLLDWTQSVWIAAYHSCATNAKDDGFIYGYSLNDCSQSGRAEERIRLLPAVKASRVNEYMKAIEAAGDGEAVFGLGVIQSTGRMIAQQSTYTFGHPGRVDHIEVIGRSLGPTGGRVIVVPMRLKGRLMERLFQMNLTGAALFPGVDGVGKTLSEIPRFGIPVPSFGTPIDI